MTDKVERTKETRFCDESILRREPGRSWHEQCGRRATHLGHFPIRGPVPLCGLHARATRNRHIQTEPL